MFRFQGLNIETYSIHDDIINNCAYSAIKLRVKFGSVVISSASEKSYNYWFFKISRHWRSSK